MAHRRIFRNGLAGLVAVAAIASAPAATAHYRAEACNGEVSVLAGDEQSPDDVTVYLDNRADEADPADIDHWIYIESNGHAGLQTGGPNALHGIDAIPGAFNFEDPCISQHGTGPAKDNADTLVF